VRKRASIQALLSVGPSNSSPLSTVSLSGAECHPPVAVAIQAGASGRRRSAEAREHSGAAVSWAKATVALCLLSLSPALGSMTTTTLYLHLLPATAVLPADAASCLLLQTQMPARFTFLSPFVISPLLRLCSPHRVTRKRGREQRKLREHQYPGSAQSSVYRVCPSLLKR
jgi:hypothetical protein